MDYAIETGALTKRFRKLTAVDGIDLRVPWGSVYDLLEKIEGHGRDRRRGDGPLARRHIRRIPRPGDEYSAADLSTVTAILVIPLLFFMSARTINTARLLVNVKRTSSGWALNATDFSALDVEGSETVFDSEYSRMFGEVVKYVRANSQPSDTVAGLPSLAVINFLTERRAPTKFVYMWPDTFLARKCGAPPPIFAETARGMS